MRKNVLNESEVVTLGTQRRVTIPRKFQERLGLRAGDRIEIAVDGAALRLTPATVDSELDEALADSAAGRVQGPFHSAEEVMAALQALKE